MEESFGLKPEGKKNHSKKKSKPKTFDSLKVCIKFFQTLNALSTTIVLLKKNPKNPTKKSKPKI